MRKDFFCIAVLMGCIFFSCQSPDKSPEDNAPPATLPDPAKGELWAEQVESQTDLRRPEGWSDADWNATVKGIEKEKILKAVTEAVLSGKLKAYNYAYDTSIYTVEEVKTMMQDLKADDLVHVRTKEQWIFDPVGFVLQKKVRSIALFTNYISSDGEIRGMRPLFYVKINE